MSTLLKFEYGENILQFEEGSSYPSENAVEKIQILDRTSSGSLQIENLGVTIKNKTLVFDLMSKTDIDNLINWFDNVVNGGQETFILTDERGDIFNVKIIDSRIAYRETDFELYSTSVNLELIT